MTSMGPTATRILIVDDTPANIELLLGALEEEYELSFATSGRQALTLLQQAPLPDLILLDVMMPEMDGYELNALLQQEPATRSIPVIFITAKTDIQSETRALSEGAVDFIHKPINTEVLRARVRVHTMLRQRTLALQQSLQETQQTQEHLRILSMAIEQSPTSVVITDVDARIEYVNPHFCEESGYSAAEAIGQNPRVLNSGLTDPAVFVEMWRYLTEGKTWKGELINRRKSGEIYWEEAHIAPVRDSLGIIRHYVAVKLDITVQKQAHERIAHLAHHDLLTNLPNRLLFFDRVNQSLAHAQRQGSRLAVMYIDLDKFKPINDSCGHAAGDFVLQQVARRLESCVRHSDTVGRIGGDEFVVLLPDASMPEHVIQIAEKIRQALKQPIEFGERVFEISSSIGIALYPDHGASVDQLAISADCAMYHAKESGRDQVILYQPQLV